MLFVVPLGCSFASSIIASGVLWTQSWAWGENSPSQRASLVEQLSKKR